MSLVSFKDTLAPLKQKIGEITSTYGSIDSAHSSRRHSGIDFSCPIGERLYAPVEGIVSKVYNEDNQALGKAVFVKTEKGFQYLIGHCSKIEVKLGEHVHVGDLLALSGNTGNSTAPHVHFGVIDKHGHFVDPDKFMSMFGNKVKDAFAYIDSISDQVIDLVQAFTQIPLAV